jgi:hypothetical protein
MDSISESRIAAAFPEFFSRAKALDVLLLEGPSPVNFRWSEVVRSWAAQAADYAEGRTSPGPPCVHDGVSRPIGTCADHPLGLKITNAPPGHSWHQYGFAGDGVPLVDGKPDWDVSGPNWAKVYEALPKVGLFSGKNFVGIKGDDDHAQLVEIPESPTAEDILTLKGGGMGTVWARYFPGSLLTPPPAPPRS